MSRVMLFHAALPTLDRARQIRGHAMAGALAAAADRADITALLAERTARLALSTAPRMRRSRPSCARAGRRVDGE